MEVINTKVLVIGGGPGGYVAAIRCGQLGLDTVLVEADRLGGTCLIRGCIPSKALIHAAGQFEAMAFAAGNQALGITLPGAPQLNFSRTVAWKDGVVDRLNKGVAGLLKRANVKVVRGWATLLDASSCRVTGGSDDLGIQADHVILAMGSVSTELGSLPFGGLVISSTEALSLPEVPKSLIVVGGGYIGLELGIAFRKLGAEVAIVEAQQQILPLYDEELIAPVRRWLKRNGVKTYLGASAIGLSTSRSELVIETSSKERLSLRADKILVAAGRQPAVDGCGLENTGIELNGRFIRVDDRCATSVKNVWAIGDLVGEPMLAHKASTQGELVAEIIAGHRRHFDPVAIPAICFTDPEIVSVETIGSDVDRSSAVVSVFPFQGNGRALSMEGTQDGGFVRITARKDDHRIIGIHAVGPHISELSGAFTQAVEMGAVLEDVAGTIYAHPTLGEAFHEAVLKGLGKPIHN